MTSHERAHETAAPMLTARSGPLSGLRIVDVTHAAAGPFATMMLADLGADVIKVEVPRGEMARHVGPHIPEDDTRAYGGRYANRNRNKRSLALDLADAGDRDTFLRLVDTADALLENLRVGVLDRLGVGWDVLQKRNSKLVYAAIRGFGDPRTGASPYADWPAYDIVAQAMGGVVSMTGSEPEAPVRAGPVFGDYIPGLAAAFGLLAAVIHARETGEGQFVDVSMVDTMLSMCADAQVIWNYTGEVTEPAGNSLEGVSPFDIFPTSDGHCAIAAPTNNYWERLASAIDKPELATDPRLDTLHKRAEHRDLVDDNIGAWMATRTTAEVMDALGGLVPVGPVLTPEHWVDDPHVAAREMLVRVDHPQHRSTAQVNTPIKFTATPGGIYRGPPVLGEHNDEIIDQLDD